MKFTIIKQQNEAQCTIYGIRMEQETYREVKALPSKKLRSERLEARSKEIEKQNTKTKKLDFKYCI